MIGPSPKFGGDPMKKKPETNESAPTKLIAIYTAEKAQPYGTRLCEILPQKTLTVPPYTTTNGIFFGHKGFFVIDPGSPYEDEQLRLASYIDNRESQGHQFLGICLTHHHGDHVKAAEFLKNRYQVPVLAHKNTQEKLGFVTRALENNDEISERNGLALTAIYTPGHTDDHLVFYQKTYGILMAGDMITDRGTTLIPPVGGSLAIYLDSLEALTRLKISALIPAHGEPITKEPIQFLLKAIKHRYERIVAIFGAISNQSERLDATDITHLVYKNSIPDNLFVFAQLSVESSLHWLKKKNLLENPGHLWRLTAEAKDLVKPRLLDLLAEIDERLRNT
jgi:glyoxylase-like metal-dependent hydrolase (beta-lactamase superfamily II)